MTAIDLPLSALTKRAAFRRMSMTHLGRSTALLIGTKGADGAFRLTISAATPRPVPITMVGVPDAATLREAISEAVAPLGWFDDVHGTPAYRAHISYHLAEEIRAELAAGGEKDA